MKDVQCYELFGGIALKNHAFSLANFYLAKLENKYMNTNLILPAHYCKYVDDIFCAFDCLENASKFVCFSLTLYIQI